MRNFIFPSQNATVYSQYPNQNTGLDEILEFGKTNSGHDVVHSLIQFDIPSTVPFSASYDLGLFIANADKLNPSQEIELCMISESWTPGIEYFYQQTVVPNDGVTWTQRRSGSFWSTGSAVQSITGMVISSSLTNPVTDIIVDVSLFVEQWISQSVPNNGLLVRFPIADEINIGNNGNIKVFSNNTHTIYKPVLIARWDDAIYSTGSVSWATSSLQVSAIVNTVYRQNEMARIEVIAREKYPLKNFSSIGTFDNLQYLPSSSWFSIIDDQSETTIIPFSNESKISSQNNQNYFILPIQNMYARRFYRVLIKVVHDGLEEIFDNNTIFTVR